jgi:hypothetical protein
MVFDEWQNGIPFAFIVIGKSWKSDLDLVLWTLSKCTPSIWMLNVILVDNVQVESMCWCLISLYLPTIPCLLLVYHNAYFVVEQNNLGDHSLLHIIFCHKLCLFCRTLVSIKTCFISCLLNIHIHFIRLLQELISINNVFPFNNIWPEAKLFLCLWHVHKTWAKNIVKRIATVEDWTKVLYVLGQIMYSRTCPLNHALVLWAQLQIDIMATKYPNAFQFIEYLKDHWTHKVIMWCASNYNIPHARKDTNVTVESFHNNMKWFYFSSREWLIGRRLDWLIFHLVGDVIIHYWYNV